MRILFIGDIFGQPGRRIVRELLPSLRQEFQPHLVLANAENAAAGFGITPTLVEELLDLDIGRLLRPANYPVETMGAGLFVGKTQGGTDYAVMNLQGRVFMPAIDCPFHKADALLAGIPPEVKIRVVDLHAEATSEKQAMGWYLDGRVTAVLGTHTHVPTADETVLPQGTAYITDVGMTGPHESIIGMERQTVIQKFIDQLPTRFEVAKGDVRLSAVLLEADPQSGRAVSIQRILRK
jgi:hypothetical protein